MQSFGKSENLFLHLKTKVIRKIFFLFTKEFTQRWTVDQKTVQNENTGNQRSPKHKRCFGALWHSYKQKQACKLPLS